MLTKTNNDLKIETIDTIIENAERTIMMTTLIIICIMKEVNNQNKNDIYPNIPNIDLNLPDLSDEKPRIKNERAAKHISQYEQCCFEGREFRTRRMILDTIIDYMKKRKGEYFSLKEIDADTLNHQFVGSLPKLGRLVDSLLEKEGFLYDHNNFCYGYDPINASAPKTVKVSPRCEDCQVDMVRRIGKHGKFWSCPNYPRCKNTARHGSVSVIV